MANLGRAIIFIWAAGSVLLAPQLRAALGDARGSERTLTRIVDVKRLTRAEANGSVPVALEGVITLYEPDRYLCFLQDASGAVYLNHVNELPVPLRPGLRVAVNGTTDSGLFAPLVDVREIRVIGDAPLPKPLRVGMQDLGTGRLDSLLIEVEGMVRAYSFGPRKEPGQDRVLRLYLNAPGEPLMVLLREPERIDLSRIVGSTVRTSGVLGVNANASGQLTSEHLLVRSAQDFKVVQPEPVDPWTAAPIAISQLLQFEEGRTSGTRVRVVGKVTLVRSRYYLMLQQGNQGVEVQYDRGTVFPLGSIVDAVGFPELGGYSPVLKDAQVRLLSGGVPVAPVEATAASAAKGEHEAQLIKVKAEVVALDKDRKVLWLHANGLSTAAFWDHTPSPTEFDKLENGSVVEVTGVARTLTSGERKEPNGFRIYIRSGEDVVLVSRPRGWLGMRTLEVLAGALLLVAIVLVWNMLLRRRVRAQTELIEKRAAFERECNEVLQMVSQSASLEDVIQKVCTLIEREIPRALCSIRLVEERAPQAETLPAVDWSTPITGTKGQALGMLTVRLPRDGDRAACDCSLINSTVRLAGIAIEHLQLCKQLVRESREDALTGIPNRLLLEDRLSHAIQQADRYRQVVACLYIDLDGFKQVNDRFGHDAGDHVLKMAAFRMKGFLRASDTVARIGGDEFCVIMPEMSDPATAELLAGKIIDCLEMPIMLEGEIVHLSASVGISYFPDHDSDGAGLLRRADAAMYVAKRDGKGRFRIWKNSEAESNQLRVA